MAQSEASASREYASVAPPQRRSASPARLVQAAGHGHLRLSTTRPNAVVKPTNAIEARMYEYLNADPTLAPLKRLTPKLFHVEELKLRRSGTAVEGPAPQSTHEVELENLCVLLDPSSREGDHGDASTDLDSEGGSSVASMSVLTEHAHVVRSMRRLGSASSSSSATPSVAPQSPTPLSQPSPLCSTGPRADGECVGRATGAPPSPVFSSTSTTNIASAAAGPLSVPTTAAETPSRHRVAARQRRTQWSEPCVLDVKLGRVRWGPHTKPEKVRHIQVKDAGCSGATLGVRLCGLRHERRVVAPSASCSSPTVDVNSVHEGKRQTEDANYSGSAAGNAEGDRRLRSGLLRSRDDSVLRSGADLAELDGSGTSSAEGGSNVGGDHDDDDEEDAKDGEAVGTSSGSRETHGLNDAPPAFDRLPPSRTSVTSSRRHTDTLHNLDMLKTQRPKDRVAPSPAATATPTGAPVKESERPGHLAHVRNGSDLNPAATAAKDRRRAVLGRRVEWTEGKRLGRSIDRTGIVQALAKFCTCVQYGLDSGTEAALLNTDGEDVEPTTAVIAARISTSRFGDFVPQPHLALVRYYRSQARELLRVLQESNILERYSFASASVICVHDFHVRVPSDQGHHHHHHPQIDDGLTSTAAPTAACPRGAVNKRVRFRAKLKLVDFSVSGPLESGEVYPDSYVGFLDGVRNLCDALDDVLCQFDVPVSSSSSPADGAATG